MSAISKLWVLFYVSRFASIKFSKCSFSSYVLCFILNISRKAKVVTTGPWVEVYPSIPLKDVSIQTNNREPSGDGRVAVWAVNKKGDVLFRNGVTMSCPQVRERCL